MAGFGLKDTKMDDADRKFELHKLELEHRFQSAKFDREQALEKENWIASICLSPEKSTHDRCLSMRCNSIAT
jgi:hypothetical protein